jgi:hypothetical protein
MVVDERFVAVDALIFVAAAEGCVAVAGLRPLRDRTQPSAAATGLRSV